MDISKTITRLGHNNGTDAKESMSPTCSEIVCKVSFLEDVASAWRQPQTQRTHLQVPMPLLSTGLVTFGYRRALLNRVQEPKLRAGGRYDMYRYTPVFVHDTLMLPGSLANLIGKGSSEDVLKRMTPALLPGHRSHYDLKTKKPSLLSSSTPNVYAQGMVLLGQGKEAREFIHNHYRPQAKRKKVQIEIEVTVPKPIEERRCHRDFWTLQRRTIWAHAWRTTGEIKGSNAVNEILDNCTNWTLEDYLAGTLADVLPMRIEANAKGDEEADGYLGRDVVEHHMEVEKPGAREVIHGGAGTLEYERIKGKKWSGW